MYVFIVFAPSSSRLSRVVPPYATVQAGHLEGYLSVGAAACNALYCQRWEVYYLKLVLTLKEPNNRLTDPGPYAWVVYIAGDTLHHQPMGMGHMTVLQFRGPITLCVLQWCHSMLTRTLRRTSCSTRMIILYGDHVIKLDSGPRMDYTVLFFKS